MPANVSVRPALADDVGFVMANWKRSWRASPWAGCIRNDEFFASIQSTIEGLIGRGAKLIVAEFPELNRLLGFCCYEVLNGGECCIHYIYVKDPYIRLGIGKELVDVAEGTKPGFYTHRFHQVSEACQHNQGWRHEPAIARRK